MLLCWYIQYIWNIEASTMHELSSLVLSDSSMLFQVVNRQSTDTKNSTELKETRYVNVSSRPVCSHSTLILLPLSLSLFLFHPSSLFANSMLNLQHKRLILLVADETVWTRNIRQREREREKLYSILWKKSHMLRSIEAKQKAKCNTHTHSAENNNSLRGSTIQKCLRQMDFLFNKFLFLWQRSKTVK